jgi:hypothetical protein
MGEVGRICGITVENNQGSVRRDVAATKQHSTGSANVGRSTKRRRVHHRTDSRHGRITTGRVDHELNSLRALRSVGCDGDHFEPMDALGEIVARRLPVAVTVV